MLDGKLQLKEGQTIALVNNPYDFEIAAPRAEADSADSVMVFATNRVELDQRMRMLRDAVERGALAWLGYPKAKQLNTDLNRDIIRDLVRDRGLDPVRQVSLDETWSGLRLKPLS